MEFTDDINWIRSHLTFLNEKEREEVQISIEDLHGAGGLHALTRAVKVEWGEQSRRYIFKQVVPTPHAQERSRSLGTAREALFYLNFAPTAQFSLPRVLCAAGSMETGEKKVVMEDLGREGVQSGYFFGPGSPLNWGKDLPSLISKVPQAVTAKDVARDAFEEMAKMHRQYWGDASLLSHNWIRAADWQKGEGKESWTASQNYAKSCWERAKDKIAKGESAVVWSEKLLRILDVSMSRISWEEYLAHRKNKPFTLVHGDFHPANIMWVWGREGGEVSPSLSPSLSSSPSSPLSKTGSVFVDWEVVGLGDGAQDLAQYMISHMTPTLRREVAAELVEHYYTTLSQGERVQESGYSLSDCWKDFAHGGSERWVWLLCILTDMCPDQMVQYFHDQVLAFMEDYDVTEDNVNMPRV